jgi:hypothetical protein
MARFRRDQGSAIGRVIGFFICGSAWLTPGCHGSLDLLVDRADAAVTVASKDGGSDAQGRPARIPPNPCTGDSDCTAVQGVCASDRHVCVECNSNSDCPPSRSCDSVTNECIGCIDASNCPSGWKCDTLTRECAMVCRDPSDCRTQWLFPICSQSRGVCTQCEENADCQFPLAVGLSLSCRSGLCQECQSNDDCPTDRPHCDERSGICECQKDEQCPAGSSCVSFFPNTQVFRRCQPTGP